MQDHLKDTAKRHTAVLNRALKKPKVGAELDKDDAIQPVMSAADFEEQEAEKEAERAKQKKLRALKKVDSLGSQGSASSFDFLRRGSSDSPKKKAKRMAKSPKDKDSIKLGGPTPKANKGISSSAGANFRSRAKQNRFIERIQKTHLDGKQKVVAFESDGWQEGKCATVKKAREKLDGILNEDENWMLFSSGQSSCLNEEGLDYRIQLQKTSEKLGLIADVMAAHEAKAAKTSTPGGSMVSMVHSLRDAVARVEAWNKLNSDHVMKVNKELQENVVREVCDECCETCNVRELMHSTALSDPLAEPYKSEADSSCNTSIRMFETEESRVTFQHDLWIAALTTSFRDKDETALVKELCGNVINSADGFFPTEGFKEDVTAIDTLTKWFLSGQNLSQCQSFFGARERCKSSSKLMRQWCNLPLGIAVLQAVDEYEELARKVTFYTSKLDLIQASLTSPVKPSMANVDAYSLLRQHATRFKHDFFSLLAGAGQEFSKLKETEIQNVVRFLESCVADLCLLRMKAMDSSMDTALGFNFESLNRKTHRRSDCSIFASENSSTCLFLCVCVCVCF